jgi:polyvinyl alcohol dehydrogenase (cytochrome)
MGHAPAESAAPSPGGWSMGGHDLSNTRSNPNQDKLNTSNADKLKAKWTFETHGDVSANPAVTGGAAYFPDWGGYIYKVAAKSGALIRQHMMN